jgi:RHS repeat-associated protein
VRKTVGASSVDFLYDLAGYEITQLSSTGAWQRGELYARSRHVGTYANGSSGTTYFSYADWLGTERVRTDVTGVTCETITSLPFGDGQTTSGSCGDPSPMHFTGKERDTESNLDFFGARHHASGLGRFMVPDWAARPTPVPYAALGNPQTLNLYAYVRNSPLAQRDRGGHCIWDGCLLEIGAGIVAGGVIAWKAASAYFHSAEARSWGVASQESFKLLSNPDFTAKHPESVDLLRKQYVSERMKSIGKTVQTGSEVLDLLHGIGSAREAAGAETGQGVEKAIGEGVEAGAGPIGDAARQSIEQQTGDEQGDSSKGIQQQQQEQKLQQQKKWTVDLVPCADVCDAGPHLTALPVGQEK